MNGMKNNIPEVPLNVWIKEFGEVKTTVRLNEKSINKKGFTLFTLLFITILYSYPADEFLKREEILKIPLLSIGIVKASITGFLPMLIALIYILFISSLLKYSDSLSHQGKMRHELYQIKTKGYLQKISEMDSNIGLDGILEPHYYVYFPSPFRFWDDFKWPKTLRNVLTMCIVSWPQAIFALVTPIIFGVLFVMFPYLVVFYVINLAPPTDWFWSISGYVCLGLMGFYLINITLTWVMKDTFPQKWYHSEFKKQKYQRPIFQLPLEMPKIKLYSDKDEPEED